MDFWRSAIRQQFRAAIDMLANAIEACLESVWSGQGRGAFEHCRSEHQILTLNGNVRDPEAAQHFRSCQIFDRVPYTVPAFGRDDR